ncbi:hypothetical protein AB0I10_34815 [Streptomyces sp. NPDC050636]|uniref:hypothetical protein n=1 Tax=Streptomyces sp. NPDC050636 TaxID=3154510 RepID=UPI00342C74D8
MAKAVAFVLGHERRVAELGRVLGLVLADRPGIGVAQSVYTTPTEDAATIRFLEFTEV